MIDESPTMDEPSAWATPEPPPEQLVSYPDKPHWGPLAAIGTWLVSVAVIIFIPLAGLAVYFGIYIWQGNAPPKTPPEIEAWLTTETTGLIQVLGNIPAHLITLAFCWLIATNRGRVPFKIALGWKWEGFSVIAKIVYLCSIVAGVFVFLLFLSLVLPPPRETSLDKLLKISPAIRISVAIMAVLSAPVVEEVVYRGVMFGGLVKKIGRVPTILVVTMLFAGVHFPQYFESQQAIAGLTFLSLVITTVRAQTRSILPCVLIHLLYNTIGAIEILARKG
ncbi:MAG TPA: CPBP family intramembrane glutamic endopeptidase [Blastocatellia bacterium]|nr:CPBP family intramembrane glutamic endopeptidase [Blastocatellia bacterium]